MVDHVIMIYLISCYTYYYYYQFMLSFPLLFFFTVVQLSLNLVFIVSYFYLIRVCTIVVVVFDLIWCLFGLDSMISIIFMTYLSIYETLIISSCMNCLFNLICMMRNLS